MVKYKIIIAVLLLIFSDSFLNAQNVTARAGVDKQVYEVGDYISYSISVNSGRDIKVSAPAIKDSLSGAELIQPAQSASEEKDGRLTTTFKYIISRYDSGEVRIPPIAVYYTSGNSPRQEVITNEVRFTVTTLKVQGEDIRDIKEPVKIPLDWKLILLWSFIILLVIACAVYLYYRKKKLKKHGEILVARKEPHEEALDALDALEVRKLWQAGRVKEYHTEITEIIRKYFEKRFHVPALEITTNELLGNLEKVKETENIRRITSDFLSNADLVKFAKYVPMDTINEEMMMQARRIVKDTVPAAVTPLGQQKEDAPNVQ